ncbi:MAG: cation-translocating P-type ATPase [Chloroflexota bacterium]
MTQSSSNNLLAVEDTDEEANSDYDPPSSHRDWHLLTPTQIVPKLNSDPEQGLTQAEATKRLKQYGPNALAETSQRSALSILVEQFTSLIVLLLVAAAGTAFLLDETVEALAILAVIVLNGIIGFLTELRAEQAITALQKQRVTSAHVIRDGEERKIPAAELVPGDVVVLSAGERVPADGRIFESVRLQVQEAMLTGESVAVSKKREALEAANGSLPLGDRVNMAYMGTVITEGRGRMLVTATGMETEVGKIGTLIDEAVTRDTPLEQRLEQLGRALIVIVGILCAVILVAGVLRGENALHMLEVAISLAIAAVPEGLPAVATMTLALGVQRMAKTNTLVRRLPAVETLGATTVICTDKTGTLTQNEMTVTRVVLNGEHVDVTGTGYRTKGDFRQNGRTIDPQENEHLMLALQIGALCNDAALDRNGNRVSVLGDPTEGALIVAAEKAGLDQPTLEEVYDRVDEVPFDSESKRMVTVHRTPEGRLVAYLKGSPAAILERATHFMSEEEIRPITEKDCEAILELNRKMAGEALRVLAVAYRELPKGYSPHDLDSELTYIGLLGMIDPLREEASLAIDQCRQAGIRTIMITGDQPVTAAEIARQLQLDQDESGRHYGTVHARDLEALDDQGWQKAVSESAVFARVSPEHKLRIVEALQDQKQVVAMTGDGVNTAPALRKADIGVAMGIKGTAVAKETADMIIGDDNFATIVKAVEQGRMIYANIVRFIHYLFSCNFSEILTVFVAIMLGWPLPLAALQILWLNIITDVLPAMALALEPSVPNVMKRQPRDPEERLLNASFAWLITWQGMLLSAVTLAAFAVGMSWYGQGGDGLRHAVTISFMTLALAQTFHAFNARSQTDSIFNRRLFTNGWLWAAVGAVILLQLAAVYVPFLQLVLRTVPLALSDWLLVLVFALLPVAVVELVKLARKLVNT